MLRICLLVVLLNSVFNNLSAQSLYFPPVGSSTWDTLSPIDLGWCPDQIPPLYSYLDSQNTKAFLVVKDGKIVLEKYFGAFTKDSLWYWASAGKSLTATLVGIAQQEGHLNILDTTSQYLGTGWTSLTSQEEDAITIRHQLTMTSGLDDGVADKDCTIDTCLKYLSPPGNRWAYHNAPYTLLDGVIQQSTGLSINQFFQTRIASVTGMTGAYYPIGYNNVFVSTPRSLARFGLLIQNKGIWNQTGVLTDTNYFYQMTHSSQNLNLAYGYLWWLNGGPTFMVPGSQITFAGSYAPDAPSDMFSALGKNGQILSIAPSKGLFFIRMGDGDGTGLVPIVLPNEIWKRLNLVMCQPSALYPEAEENNTLQIYPNPAQQAVLVKSKKEKQWELFSATGVKLGTYPTETPVNLNSLSPGIYFIRTQLGEFSRPLIIQP